MNTETEVVSNSVQASLDVDEDQTENEATQNEIEADKL